MKKYKLIKQDTFRELELNRIYEIEDRGNHFTIENAPRQYILNNWQLETMFEEVKEL